MDLSRPLIVGERAKMILNMQITNDISFLNEVGKSPISEL
jgi:hypothetical protein